MFIPKWILLLISFLMASLIFWLVLIALGRNPLPFPDNGSRIFSAASAEGKDAIWNYWLFTALRSASKQTVKVYVAR